MPPIAGTIAIAAIAPTIARFAPAKPELARLVDGVVVVEALEAEALVEAEEVGVDAETGEDTESEPVAEDDPEVVEDMSEEMGGVEIPEVEEPEPSESESESEFELELPGFGKIIPVLSLTSSS